MCPKYKKKDNSVIYSDSSFDDSSIKSLSVSDIDIEDINFKKFSSDEDNLKKSNMLFNSNGFEDDME